MKLVINVYLAVELINEFCTGEKSVYCEKLESINHAWVTAIQYNEIKLFVDNLFNQDYVAVFHACL